MLFPGGSPRVQTKTMCRPHLVCIATISFCLPPFFTLFVGEPESVRYLYKVKLLKRDLTGFAQGHVSGAHGRCLGSKHETLASIISGEFDCL